jgi:hypothetical protein
LFQNAAISNYYISCFDEGKREQFTLNMSIPGEDGEPIVYNDVSYLPISLEFKELKDTASSADLRKENAQFVAQNLQLLNLPSILEDLGFHNVEKYISDYRRLQERAAQQNEPYGYDQGQPAMQQDQGIIANQNLVQ